MVENEPSPPCSGHREKDLVGAGTIAIAAPGCDSRHSLRRHSMTPLVCLDPSRLNRRYLQQTRHTVAAARFPVRLLIRRSRSQHGSAQAIRSVHAGVQVLARPMHSTGACGAPRLLNVGRHIQVRQSLIASAVGMNDSDGALAVAVWEDKQAAESYLDSCAAALRRGSGDAGDREEVGGGDRRQASETREVPARNASLEYVVNLEPGLANDSATLGR